MALSPGSWLNHYEILGHLGTGGMGEVYKARDRRLERFPKKSQENLADEVSALFTPL